MNKRAARNRWRKKKTEKGMPCVMPEGSVAERKRRVESRPEEVPERSVAGRKRQTENRPEEAVERSAAGKNKEEEYRTEKIQAGRAPYKKICHILESKGYHVIRFEGAGSFSDVYKVKEIKSGVFRACKVSRDGSQLRKESSFLAASDHPLFPGYKEHWQTEGLYFLVMEYLSGRSLENMLVHRGRLSQKQAVRVARELAQGLAYMEESPVPMVFRDLKPENIKIMEDGTVKLMDFGCICPVGQKKAEIVGTPGYAPPEQMRPEGKAGAYSDVYALGRILHYMLTGDSPYSGKAGGSGNRAGRRICGSLERLVEDCVREEAAERIPDMRRVLWRLRDISALLEGGNILEKIYIPGKRERQAPYIYEKNICIAGRPET